MGVKIESILGRHVTASFADGERELHFSTGCQMTDNQFGIQYLEEREVVRNISCRQLRYTRHIDRYLLGILVVNRADKTNLLEIQDDVDHTFHHSRDSGKLMVHAGNLDGRNRIPLQRGEQDTAQSVTDGHTKPRLQRSEFELSERRSGFEHDNLFRFLKC